MDGELNIPHNFYNTPDVKVRPKDREKDSPMILDLPDDVIVNPSVAELKKLERRMRSYNIIAYKVRQDRLPTESEPTSAAELPEEFGGKSVLIAIDRDSLSRIKSNDVGNSTRLPEVQNLIAETPDPTHILPIFVEKARYLGEQSDSIRVRDGNHRVAAAIDNEKIPYLLAYVRADDLFEISNQGIVYRSVRSTRSEV